MLQTYHLEKIKISKNILGFLGGIFEKYFKIYIFIFDWSRCAGLSICLSTFDKKKSDPTSDHIYRLKIAVEILGVNPPFGWGVNFAPTCISGSDYRIETIQTPFDRPHQYDLKTTLVDLFRWPVTSQEVKIGQMYPLKFQLRFCEGKFDLILGLTFFS